MGKICSSKIYAETGSYKQFEHTGNQLNPINKALVVNRLILASSGIQRNCKNMNVSKQVSKKVQMRNNCTLWDIKSKFKKMKTDVDNLSQLATGCSNGFHPPNKSRQADFRQICVEHQSLNIIMEAHESHHSYPTQIKTWSSRNVRFIIILWRERLFNQLLSDVCLS